MPFCFYTDGGCYNDDYYYFIHNIFTKTGICHSTRTPRDVNIQAYLGKKIIIDPSSVLPKNIRVKSSDATILKIPF